MNISLLEFKKRNIRFTNVRNIYGKQKSEYVISLMLYDTRDIGRFIRNTELKNYDRDSLVDKVMKKTIGVFGTGAIGKEVAKKPKHLI